MNKILVSTVLAAGALMLSAATSFAAVSCVTQYGTIVPYAPGEVCVRTGEIQINKEVFNPNPKVNKFVDNVVPADRDPQLGYTFAPQEEVKFRLRIKNIGDNTLDKVQVTDTLPGMLEKIDGQIYAFEITDLKVDQVVEREITARFVPITKLTQNQTCEVNKAEVQSGDKHDSDTAQGCVEKKKAAELPKAGAEGTFATLLGSGVFGYIGLKLSRIKKLIK